MIEQNEFRDYQPLISQNHSMVKKMKRTLENCSLIKIMGDKGTGEPRQIDGKCVGYCTIDDDEPCKICKKCKLNEFYEENL